MALCIPIIRGPLTEWSDNFLVEGCLPGATVVVSSIGPSPRTLGKRLANGGSDRVPLLTGEKLQPQDLIVVFQTQGSDSSVTTPAHLATPVAPAPVQHAALSPLAFRTHVYPCGRAIWVAGAVPGARITVKISNQVVASGRATESGDARMTLAAGAVIGLSASLTASQEAPPGFAPLSGAPKETTVVADKVPVPMGTKLPTPILTAAPPRGCDSSVHIGAIVDGADVSILRASDGTKEVAIFDLDRLRFDLTKPLPASGDKLEITQALMGCAEWLPSDPLVVYVDPAKKPGAPTLFPPCADSIDVFASNLEPGAIVTVSFMSEDFRAMVPQDSTSFVFRISKLTAGGTITIVQEKCGLKSDPVSIQGTTSSGPYFPPDLEEPLFECARAVRVRAKPGTWLQVWGNSGPGPGPISAQIYCTGSTRIYVAPYLSANQEVWLASLKCGATTWDRSPSHWVQPTPDVGPPHISVPLVEGARSVTVDAIPGALVHVYSFGGSPPKVQLLGDGVVDPIGKSVFLWRSLTTKELIYAVQFICHHMSRPSAAQVPIPNLRAFYLGAPLKRLSNQSSSMKPLVCLSATVVCRHDGGWEYTAELENEETEADVSFDLQFDILAVTPPFGAPLAGSLSAAGNGPITKTGLRAQGVPPKKTFSRSGHFPGFQDPTYWATVYEASHKFDLTNVAWKNYLPSPEEPEYEDKPDKKPGTKK